MHYPGLVLVQGPLHPQPPGCGSWPPCHPHCGGEQVLKGGGEGGQGHGGRHDQADEDDADEGEREGEEGGGAVWLPPELPRHLRGVWGKLWEKVWVKKQEQDKASASTK